MGSKAKKAVTEAPKAPAAPKEPKAPKATLPPKAADVIIGTLTVKDEEAFCKLWLSMASNNMGQFAGPSGVRQLARIVGAVTEEEFIALRDQVKAFAAAHNRS